MSKYMWGDEDTQFFNLLDPIRILKVVDQFGLRTTGRCLPLNALENRVYEVEVEVRESDLKSYYDRFRVVKFYRPGRWSLDQIREEHNFLQELHEEEIPVIVPLSFGGETLFKMDDVNIWYSLFPKIGGRLLSELSEKQLERLGVVMAQIHMVGKRRPADHRIHLSPETYGKQNLQFLLEKNIVPAAFQQTLSEKVNGIINKARPLFARTAIQRIHGDAHYGNVLWMDEEPLVLDFDDMVMGPPVQDIWTLVLGADEESLEKREILLESYESICNFDRESLRLVPPLRAFRQLHFAAWIAKRWDDQSFQRTFPDFGSQRYWSELIIDLSEIYQSFS